MNIGTLGIISSVAATPLSQTKGADVDKAAADASQQARQVESERRAEQAAGIGHTEQDEQASDRDADGRRLWEDPSKPRAKDVSETPQADSATASQSKDPTGNIGQRLDLSG